MCAVGVYSSPRKSVVSCCSRSPPSLPPVFGAFLCLTAGRGAQETPGYRGEAAPLPHPARRTRGGPARAFSANRRRRSPSPPSRGGGEGGAEREGPGRKKSGISLCSSPPFFPPPLPPLLVRMDKKKLDGKTGQGAIFSQSENCLKVVAMWGGTKMCFLEGVGWRWGMWGGGDVHRVPKPLWFTGPVCYQLPG